MLDLLCSSFRLPQDFLIVLTCMFLQTAFTTQKDFGREAREAAWAKEQRTLHGLPTMEHTNIFHERHTFRDVSMMAEEARRRAEIARLVSFSSLDIFSSSFLHTNNIYIELKYIYTLLMCFGNIS